jgi:hypothetical protein
MVSLVLTMLNVLSNQSSNWIIQANLKRMAKKDPNSVLYALVAMKARAPQVKLRDAYNASPDLFSTESLLKRVYGAGTE